MERIVYRKTLDVHKAGIQFTLQGFQTADNMARRIEINLMANGDTIDLASEKLVALMYVKSPSASEPSINGCSIKGNTITYDVLPIVEGGITEMQLKLIETSPTGARSVLAAPMFAVEVSGGGMDVVWECRNCGHIHVGIKAPQTCPVCALTQSYDEGAEQTPTFTALEDALAKANSVYETRIKRIVLSPDCVFTIYYADGTIYESDALKDIIVIGESVMSKSFARGGTGVRDGENTDNSMYYSTVSKSAALDSDRSRGEAEKVLVEVRKHGIYTAFNMNFASGELEYVSPMYSFDVDEATGELVVNGIAYSIEDNIKGLVEQVLKEKNLITGG